MKTLRRKVSLQLMPLLDLMLIVIFAQYMAMREQSQHEEVHAAQVISDAEQQRQQLREERAALTEQRREAELIADTAFNQRDLVGQLASELFNLPDDVVAKLLRQRFPDDPPNEAEIAAMQKEFRKLRGRRGQEVVKHLLTFNEIRKRCDIWEVYVSDTGVTTLKAGGEETSFRADTPQTFAARLFGSYRMAPQPKSLVLVLFSHGNAPLGVVRAALNGFPPALEKMQADSQGRSRFEYAVLGYDPKPPAP